MKATIVGTRYPHDTIALAAKQATAICVKAGCEISTGDAIGIDKIASSTARSINRNKPALIFSAKDKTYPWRNDWTYYLDQLPYVNVARAIAQFIHPAWDKCGDYAKDLHTRNCYQVMGVTLLEPTDVTLTFAPYDNKVTGGTRTAYMLSSLLGIPTFNLYGKGDVVVDSLWNKIFLSSTTLDWEFIESSRTTINPALKEIILNASVEDIEFQKSFLTIYGGEV